MGAQGCMKERKRCDEGVDGLSIRLVHSSAHSWGGRSRAGGEVSAAATTAAQIS